MCLILCETVEKMRNAHRVVTPYLILNDVRKPAVLRNSERLMMLISVFIFLLFLSPSLALALDSLCAEVKIEISQELTLERQAFDAHMRINNGLDNIALENVTVEVSFADEEGNAVLASSDAANGDALFFIRLDSMDGINNISGSGSVAPSTAADIHWLIIPATGASNGVSNGTLYYIGATLSYTLAGVANVTEITPDYIFVKPMPELTLDYFLPTDVYGDDAFTPEIEPAIPFTLGVRINNTGFGTAYNLKIDSAQPKIIENEHNLLVNFVIEGSQVNGQAVTPSLLVDFGDIAPDSSGVASWIMTSSLSGQFVDFTARFSHADELGGELTSLISEINTHELVRSVLVDLPGRDETGDFLVIKNENYRVYESEATDFEVSNLSTASTLELAGQIDDKVQYNLSTPVTAGFGYLQLTDPHDGDKVIAKVIRSDGKRIREENTWLSKTRDDDNNWHFFFNLFDADFSGHYTVVFADQTPDENSPVWQFIPDKTVDEGQTLSFLVQASSTISTPALSVQTLPDEASFVDNQDGSGVFSWTPISGQAGTYEIIFVATQGNLQKKERMIITVNQVDDSDEDGMLDSWEMDHFGTLDRNGLEDFDGDGISDLNEFLNDTDPTVSNYPSVPVILAPQIGEELTTLTPQLIVAEDTVTERAPIHYIFEVYRKGTPGQAIAASGEIEETSGETAWQVETALTDNQWYDWRVRATDGSAYSSWAYGRFFTNTANNPPGNFYTSIPVDGSEVTNQTPTLAVTNSFDPDDDVLYYVFYCYDSVDLNNLVAQSNNIAEGKDGFTSCQLITSLNDGTDYYWQAVAKDEHGAETMSDVAHFTVNSTNEAPETPILSTPVPDSQLTVVDPFLSVANSTDPDGDSVKYFFELDTTSTFDSINLERSGEVQETLNSTGWQVTGLVENSTYFWRVRASDGLAGSLWNQSRFFINLINDPPSTPVLKNPGNSAWVGRTTPSLSVHPCNDPDHDDLTYMFEVYTEPELINRVSWAESNLPVWIVTDSLPIKNWYYWRVRAADSHGLEGNWMTTATFYVLEEGDPPADFDQDSDGDVDGIDLAHFATGTDLANLAPFAEAFGRVVTTPLQADFDEDGDVDGLDLATFAINSGQLELSDFAANYGHTD